MFYDQAKIYVQAGDGGDGCVAFRREKYVPYGGPAGGDGGRGGDVVLYVDSHLNTLYRFSRQRHFRAGRGEHGRGKNQHGAAGESLRVPVPPGSVVYDADTEELLGDLTEVGQELTVAHGGRGGRGNARFATSTNQSPRIAEHGETGEERWLRLDLKLLADVGVVGLPNAGKSTLLAATTAARPKIAPYPFTTLQPNLGVVVLDAETEFVLADVPGLIEGASQGKGLGHEFLRHVERTRVLIHLLDGLSADPLADLDVINGELSSFDPRLAAKPQLVAFNKIDLPEARARWPEVEQALKARGCPALAISALAREGTRELLYRAARMLADLPDEETPAQELPVFRLGDDEAAFTIEREGKDRWRVRGGQVERFAAMTVWNLEEAVRRFQRTLDRLGISEALEEAGVQPGDTVCIGDVELVWEE
ncbi:MAG TPA: GTPase ObgE [Chloroflexi bacterium]|nr:GTPase ObgE [Chloroflexota bacterium]